MGLENTVAKYEINIARTGDGASQAASAFKDVESAAKNAKHETSGAGEALEELHSSGLLGRDGLHAFNAVAEITGSEAMPAVRESVMAAHAAMNLLSKGAAATGTSFSAMLVGIVGLTAALATAITGWQAYKAAQEAAKSEEESMRQAIELTKKVVELVDKYQAQGIMSVDYWAKLRGSLDYTSEGLLKVQRSLLDSGYSGGSVAALEKYQKLAQTIHDDALNAYESERSKAAETYNERMKELANLARESKLITPADVKSTTDQAGKAYSQAVNISLDKESEAKFKAESEALEATIAKYQADYGATRTGLASKEFEARLALYRTFRNSTDTQEALYTQRVLEATKTYAVQAAAELESVQQENQAETLQMIKDFDSQQKVEANTAKGDKIAIAKQEYQAKLEFIDDLATQNRLSADQVVDMWNEALEKETTAIKNAESKETIHVKNLAEMEKSAAESFASDFSSAFTDFVDGTKSAEEAFKDFAKSFLEEILKMIIQQQILNALKTAFGGGGVSISGGSSVAGVSGDYGGELAMGGVRMAASGLSGVSSVSSPTYLPRFNVLAGEAGREMLTVLAKPRTMSIGGVEAVVGNAGKNTLAITSASDLANAGGSSGGKIQIEISHSDESKANIISSSIQGAEVRITQRAQQNTQLRASLRKAVS